MLLKAYITFLWLNLVSAELYTAVTDLEQLLDTESVLINTLDSYIERQQTNLEMLKRRSVEFKKGRNIESQDSNEYLSNPINAFLLIKRITIDWDRIENLMTSMFHEVQRNITLNRDSLKFPNEEDLDGAAVALIRLQETYGIDSKSIARGELSGVQYSTKMTANDCFELGRLAHNNRDYNYAVLWMEEALKRYERGQTEVEKWIILEHLSNSTFMLGNLERAIQLTDELLEIAPYHPSALQNEIHYRALKESVDKSNNQTSEQKSQDILDIYTSACRGLASPPIEIAAQLKCRYVDHKNPFLRLAPFKEEEVYLDPRIVIYRDIIDDSEIEVIKNIAGPKLERAKVEDVKQNLSEIAQDRISKSSWLLDNENQVVARISKRIEHMTGLTTSTAEPLQVANYGIGGYYATHFDFFRLAEETDGDDYIPSERGDRIATVLFYLSDVTQGGATVFPRLELTLWPEKGSAAFWYNLLPSGQGDFRTFHAACPVLVGSKWVCNKWLRERGQEFLRPCTLNYERNRHEIFA